MVFFRRLSVGQRVVIVLFLFIISIVTYKVENYDHQWSIEQRIGRYIVGWHTVENAIKNGRWNSPRYEVRKIDVDSFAYRLKVNVFTGYLLPIVFFGLGIVLLMPGKTGQNEKKLM